MKTRETQPRRSLHWLVSWHCYDGGFWLRILGRGISVVNKQKHPPLFSERNGYRRVRRIGKWGVEWLPANVGDVAADGKKPQHIKGDQA